MMDAVLKARIVITNYHSFLLKETEHVSKLNRQILGGREGEKRFTETVGEMVARVCREGGADLMGRKNIIVLNDEAHHCYRHKVVDEEDEARLTRDEREEAEENPRPRASGSAALKLSPTSPASKRFTTSPPRRFSARLRLPGGPTFFLGRLRFWPHGCDRKRHRQSATPACGRRCDQGRFAEVPRPLQRHPQGQSARVSDARAAHRRRGRRPEPVAASFARSGSQGRALQALRNGIQDLGGTAGAWPPASVHRGLQ